jgi:hypothetical protein
MNHRKGLLAVSLLLTTLTACTSTDPTPTPRQASAAPTGVASEPLVFRYQTAQLRQALPTHYRGIALANDYYRFNPNRSYTPRPDPLAGRSIDPESCRAHVRGEAWPSGQYGGIPSETPSGDVTADLGAPTGELQPYVSAVIVELTGDNATKFLGVRPKIGPECAGIRIAGSPSAEHASAVERSLPEFGPDSRYQVRSYPLGGRQWVERILLYRSPYYVTEVRIQGSQDSEAEFLTFARQTRDLAAGKLK